MSRRTNGSGDKPTPMMNEGRGPWDAPEPADGSGAAGAGQPAPKAGKPRSPWQPPEDQPAGADGSRRGASRAPRSLDELWRRTGGGAGGGLPGGRGVWLAVAGALGVLWLLSTSMWQLEPNEEGVVTRFGSYSRTVGSGLNFTLPAPFERMQVVSNEIMTETIPQGSGENLVLTGDANLVDLSYSVRWSISQPERFLFQVDDPQGTIRAAAESAIRATLANFTLAQVLGPGRVDIQRQVQQRLQVMLNSYRVGVRIEGVSVDDADPPAQVAGAFNDVNAARQQAESMANEARADAQTVLRRAQGEAAAFSQIYEQYARAPEVTRRRMYYETIEEVLRPADKIVVGAGAGGVTPYLPLPEVRRRPQPAPAASGASAPGRRGAGNARPDAAPSGATPRGEAGASATTTGGGQ